MAACFPTKTPETAHKDILLYQKARNLSAKERKMGLPGTDWEGEQALFRKFIRMSLAHRRKQQMSSDIVRKKAA